MIMVVIARGDFCHRGELVDNAFVRKLSECAPEGSQEAETLASVRDITVVLPARHDLIREGDKWSPVYIVLEGRTCRSNCSPNAVAQHIATITKARSPPSRALVMGSLIDAAPPA